MAIKKNIFLCLITFIIALHETTLYAQNSHLLLQKLNRPNELLAMNNPVMEVDTSELAFFSFEEGRAVPYRRKFVNTEDSKTSTVYVCENNSVVLSTPDFGQDAIYSWKGPAGFSSLSQQIRLEKITPFQAGFYNFTIRKNGSTTIGKIKVMVKERPKAIATGGRFCVGEAVKLTTAEAGVGVTYRWTLPPTDFTAYTPEVSVENLAVGNYTYYLSVSKNGCKSVDTAKVEVRQLPVAIANNASIKVGQTATLEAHDAGNDAEYVWKGPFIETIKDKVASLKGLTAGKYIYVLRVLKQGCSSMNIATVEVQKDDAKASIKN
jgi:Ig-like domain CHU_C associated